MDDYGICSITHLLIPKDICETCIRRKRGMSNKPCWWTPVPTVTYKEVEIYNDLIKRIRGWDRTKIEEITLIKNSPNQYVNKGLLFIYWDMITKRITQKIRWEETK